MLITQDVDAAGSAAIQLSHSTDVGEGNHVAFLERMAIFHDGHQTFCILSVKQNKRRNLADITNQTALRLLVIHIHHSEGLTEITENTHGKTVSIRTNEANIVSVTNLVNDFLLVVHEICCDDNLN